MKTKFEQQVIDSKIAKEDVEKYYTWIITADNPLRKVTTPENWAKPDIYPCCHKFNFDLIF